MEYNLFETHLYVANLERSAAFYEEILELPRGHHEAARRANFYWLGGYGKAMLGVWEVKPEQVRRQHFAFGVSVDGLKEVVATLKAKGVTLRNFKEDNQPQLHVLAWMPAVSVYFTDPDGHSLEYLAMLPDQARPELGLVEWAEWERMHGRPTEGLATL